MRLELSEKENWVYFFDNVNFVMSASHLVDMSGGRQFCSPGAQRFKRRYTDGI